ncbi:hypothetical protein [Desulfofustis glycolicus]|uniref:hypothetical protein n=1 Tax=Desulfofustis glycolicus TaxID=51195 RepID=UPI001160FFEA|nr:hypothetical protein [Desulfofustis glycolicus]MCB2216866.1 hypothetical protein [Desulfobulbaceae bacterium]
MIQIEYGMPLPQKGVGQLFWSDGSDGYREDLSVRFPLTTEQAYYAVQIPALIKLDSVRLDPIDGDEIVFINSITIQEKSSSPQRFTTTDQLLKVLLPFNGTIKIGLADHGLYLLPLTNDPQLLVNLAVLDKNPLLPSSLLAKLVITCSLGVISLLFVTIVFKYIFHAQKGTTFSRFILVVEVICSILVTIFVLTYLGTWIAKMSTSSLWTDEIYTIEKFSSQEPVSSLTDYHAANNHILFNVFNSLLPGSASFDPFRARILSFLAVISSTILSLGFFFRRQWFAAGALTLVALTNSWPHLVLMLEARGYGLVVFWGVVLSYSVVSYLSKGGIPALSGAVAAGVLGTMTIPTFGFFAMPLLVLLALKRRCKLVILAILAGFGFVAALYLPLLPQLLEIKEGYSDKWGAEYSSVKAVVSTLTDYLFPEASMTVILLVLMSIAIIAFFPWWKLNGLETVENWKPISYSIIIFFAICLILETPAVRTTAFIVLPITIMLLSVFSVIVNLNIWIRFGWVVAFTVLSIMICYDYVYKHEILNTYYRPKENWKGTADLIQNVFSSEDIVIFNNFRTKYLQKYLPDDYLFVEEFSLQDYQLGALVVVDSNPWSPDRFATSEYFEDSLYFRVPQDRREYQTLLYRVPNLSKFTILNVFVDNGSIGCAGSIGLDELNRCRNYIDKQWVEIVFRQNEPVYSFNLTTIGMTADSITEVSVAQEKGGWQELPAKSIVSYFQEGRPWARHHNNASLISISLNGIKNISRLRFAIKPIDVEQTSHISSMWFQ